MERPKPSLIERIGFIFDRLLYWLAVFCGVLFLFLLVSVTVSVLSRQILVRPMAWTIEISEYILPCITFLGAAWLLRNDGHVKVDILLNRLSPEAQRKMKFIAITVQIFVCAVLSYFGALTTLELFVKHIPVIKVLAIPKFLIVCVIPLGFFLLLIQSLRMLWHHLTGGNGY